MRTTLLNVRLPRRPHEASALDPSPIPYDECEDIYRALARLCRPDGAAIDTVVVALDGLLSDEFEFFALARRFRPDVTIYVHAHDDARNLIAMAIEQGAAGEFTEEIRTTLRGRCEPSDAPFAHQPPSTDDPPQAQQPQAFSQYGEPHSPECAMVDQEDPDHEQQAPLDVADQQQSGPARVPWSDRQDAPRRIRPSAGSWTRDTDDKPADEPNSNAPDPDALAEPLLTQEELAALISDEGEPPLPTDDNRSSDSEAPS